MNYPSVMVCIKKFYLDEMIDEALHVPHTTFIVAGAELDEVSLYANNGADERITFRGGCWGQGLNSGIFKTRLDGPGSFSETAVRFRSTYYNV